MGHCRRHGRPPLHRLISAATRSLMPRCGSLCPAGGDRNWRTAGVAPPDAPQAELSGGLRWWTVSARPDHGMVLLEFPASVGDNRGGLGPDVNLVQISVNEPTKAARSAVITAVGRSARPCSAAVVVATGSDPDLLGHDLVDQSVLVGDPA